MYRLVLSDLDGTLLNHEKQLSERTIQTVDKLIKKGIRFVPATGRLDVMAKPYLKAMKGTDIVIGCDGALVRNRKTGETLYENTLPADVEGTEKVDNTACIWYNVYIKYRRCFYDRTTAEIGVKSIHGNI